MTKATQATFVGGCACGAVRFEINGPPKRAGLCHCLTCRKAHAAAFSPFVVFARAQVNVSGALKSWLSSPDYDRQFCAVCGSRVIGVNGAEVEISLGSFDEPNQVTPQYESWIKRREAWLSPLDLPQYDEDRTPGD